MIRIMQIKITMKNHLTLLEHLLQREREKEVWGRSVERCGGEVWRGVLAKGVEKSKSLYTVGAKLIQRLKKTVWTVLKEFKI